MTSKNSNKLNSSKNQFEPDPAWPVSYEDNALAQLKSTLSATPQQRLDWLYEMQKLALKTTDPFKDL